MILLGKHNFWSKLGYYLILPHWFTADIPNKKTKDELWYGMIPHKHEYDYEHPFVEQGITLARCKHYGCYVSEPFECIRKMEEDNKWLKKQIHDLDVKYGNDLYFD